MKRDLDLQREILLAIEDHDGRSGGPLVDISSLHEDKRLLRENAQLLHEAGFLEGYTSLSTGFKPNRLTHAGHDYLDTIRDDDIWDKSKKAFEAAGIWSLDLLADLTKGFVKTKIAKHTGVDL